MSSSCELPLVGSGVNKVLLNLTDLFQCDHETIRLKGFGFERQIVMRLGR